MKYASKKEAICSVKRCCGGLHSPAAEMQLEMQLQFRREKVCRQTDTQQPGADKITRPVTCASVHQEAVKDTAKRPMINEITTRKITATLMLQ